MTTTFLYRDDHPTQPVVYQWTDGRRYRCSDRAWEQVMIELIESGKIDHELKAAGAKCRPIKPKVQP